MNRELEQYFNILCKGDYPKFIDKYIKTFPLQRLKYIGQFCGCDYTKIYKIKEFYSRLDHSIACALMVYHFTQDKLETLAALFHDLGTPCFSHVIDFYYKDFINQNSSELHIYDILSNCDEIKKLLKEDNIDINDFKNLDKFPILENNKPKLCVDRLDGVLHTSVFWLDEKTVEDIKDIYNDLAVLINENNKKEIGFKSEKQAVEFFKLIYRYSIELQSGENKYVTKYLSDSITILIDKKIIKIEDLYSLKEYQIVELFKKHIPSFETFQNLDKVSKSKDEPEYYYVSLTVKKRYVNPLVNYDNNNFRISDKNDYCRELLNDYLEYNEFPYVYSKHIKNI